MEAVVILVVPLIALIIIGGAVLQPRHKDLVEERSRLDQRIAWLESRLTHARQSNWDEDMIARINEQLDEAQREMRLLPAA